MSNNGQKAYTPLIAFMVPSPQRMARREPTHPVTFQVSGGFGTFHNSDMEIPTGRSYIQFRMIANQNTMKSVRRLSLIRPCDMEILYDMEFLESHFT